MMTSDGEMPIQDLSHDDLPLRCRVVNGALHFCVGAQTIKWAVENHPELLSISDYGKPTFLVDDPVAFLNELVAVINREEEDGSTLLTRMLDDAIIQAVEDGSDGLRYVEDGDPADLDEF